MVRKKEEVETVHDTGESLATDQLEFNNWRNNSV